MPTFLKEAKNITWHCSVAIGILRRQAVLEIPFHKELIKARGAENLSRRSLSTLILSAGRSLTGLSDFGHTSPLPCADHLIPLGANPSGCLSLTRITRRRS